MSKLLSRPLFTQRFEQPGDFRPASGSTYFYGRLEERSEHVEGLKAAASGVDFVELKELDGTEITADIEGGERLSLRRRDHVEKLLARIGSGFAYIDLTGLSHHVWAPLTRLALASSLRVRAVYVEPHSYQYSADQGTRGEIFDLSERIRGISPIPLFASLAEARRESTWFVPFLGFEGARFAFVAEQIDPPPDRIIPVVGVPGFRIEYPFHSVVGNARVLGETRAWQRAVYARANCPFSAFFVLQDIMADRPGDHLRVAPIGTKPHALGAVLMACVAPQRIELVYDHPKRKPKRTVGKETCFVYSLTEFLLANPAASAPAAF